MAGRSWIIVHINFGTRWRRVANPIPQPPLHSGETAPTEYRQSGLLEKIKFSFPGFELLIDYVSLANGKWE
jgi:hypothetical protein